MEERKKAIISLIIWFVLFTIMNVLFGISLYKLNAQAVSLIGFNNSFFKKYLFFVSLHLPIISYSFYFARKSNDQGQIYRLAKHFFITNLGFSLMGVLGMISELL